MQVLSNEDLIRLATLTLAQIKEDIAYRNVLGYGSVNVSGQAMDSLFYDIQPNGFTIYSEGKAADYILNLEYGQKPGNYPDLTELEKWVRARAIESDPKEAKKAAKAIARAIFRDGTLFWQEFGSKGKGSGVLTNSISNAVLQANIDKITGGIAFRIQNEIIATFAQK